MESQQKKQYCLGIDYGTSSMRVLLVRAEDGAEVCSVVREYPSGFEGVLLDDKDPLLARQAVIDYPECLIHALVKLRQHVGDEAMSAIGGIGSDTTGSSPIPVGSDGKMLGLRDNMRARLAAQCWLWKDHTAHAEATEITETAAAYPYLAKCGGTYSSEWWWSKILHCARTDPEVFELAESWIELQDAIPGLLIGADLRHSPRGICAAGHKAMYNDEWGGLPSTEFLNLLDPRLGALRTRLPNSAVTADNLAGGIHAEIAERTGIPEGTPVAVGLMDAHSGAVGSGIQPGTLVKVMGTSTCDLMVGSGTTPDIPGVCGIVPGSILPGMMGIEAGQSAVGDLFGWWARETGSSHAELSRKAEELQPGESGLLALDWNNGNRTVLVDPLLTGLLVGQTLHTTTAEIYRALIEATAFGSLAIIQRIESFGVPVERIVTGGGIAEKSTLTMQIYADVCGRPIHLSRSNQTCALGAAIFGSVVGGMHPDISTAVQHMTGLKDRVYTPNPAAHKVYRRLYGLYMDLHDAFGRTGRHPNLEGLMKELLLIRKGVKN